MLIVDDQADARRVLRGALAPLGFALDECETGAAALHWLGVHRTDLILMDVAMPGLDGFEVAAIVRDRALSEAPILVLSANAYAEDIARSDAAGCDGFLAKPVNLRQLQDRLAALLHLEWTAAPVEDMGPEAGAALSGTQQRSMPT